MTSERCPVKAWFPGRKEWLPIDDPFITWRLVSRPDTRRMLYQPSKSLRAQVSKATAILQENMRRALGGEYVLYRARKRRPDWT